MTDLGSQNCCISNIVANGENPYSDVCVFMTNVMKMSTLQVYIPCAQIRNKLKGKP